MKKTFEPFEWLTRMNSKHRKAAMTLDKKNSSVLGRDS